MKYLLTFLAFALLGICIIGGVNYYFDPYGLRDNKGRFAYNLIAPRKYLLNARISSKRELYLIGSSRLLEINPLFVEKMSGKSVASYPKPGTSFAELVLLFNRLKDLHPDAVLLIGLDPYMPNVHAVPKKQQLDAYKETLSTYAFPYFNVDMSYVAAKFYIKHLMHDKTLEKFEARRNAAFAKEDATKYKAVIEEVQKRLYPKYTADMARAKEMAKRLTSKDTIIIFPKYYYFYCRSVRVGSYDEYFRLIKYLLDNSPARVISFYGITPFSIKATNFDSFRGYPHHFLPKVSYKIFSDIYAKTKPKYGVWLSRENIASYVYATRKEVLEYCKAHEKDLEE